MLKGRFRHFIFIPYLLTIAVSCYIIENSTTLKAFDDFLLPAAVIFLSYLFLKDYIPPDYLSRPLGRVVSILMIVIFVLSLALLALAIYMRITH